MPLEPAFQFQDAGRQAHAAKFGMWIFLSTEVMFFAALFTGYAVYRINFPAAFLAGSRHLETMLGVVETVDLITSSLFMALSIHFVRTDRRNAAMLCLLLTILLGLAFLGIHSYEYYTDAVEGALPGRFYHFAAIDVPGASMFFTVYFFLTGLHAFHVAVGVALLMWLSWRTWLGRFSSAYDTPVDNVGLYWHLVDLFWIFLFPLFYLVD